MLGKDCRAESESGGKEEKEHCCGGCIFECLACDSEHEVKWNMPYVERFEFCR